MSRLSDLAILLTNDLTGISRGRAFPAADLAERMQAGVGWVPANRALTPLGVIGANPFGPLGDLRLQPDPDRAGVLCDIVEADGSPRGGCGCGFAGDLSATGWLPPLLRQGYLALKAAGLEWRAAGLDHASQCARYANYD